MAVETLGSFRRETKAFIRQLLISTTSDPMSRAFLVQRIAVAIQRENAASVLGSCDACNLCVCDYYYYYYSIIIIMCVQQN